MSPPLSLPLDDERLAVEAADGLLAAELLGTVFPAEGSVTGEVIRTGRAVVLADASADPRSAQPIVRAGVGPAVFVPLAVRGRTLGTLTVATAPAAGCCVTARSSWSRPSPSRPRWPWSTPTRRWPPS
jgi:GAF domain-containing protein